MLIEVHSGTQEKRNSSRYEMIYPVIYARFDHQGREYDQKPSRLMNMSLGGIALQTNFPIDPGEILDISLALEDRLVALEDRLVTFMGKVVYLIPYQDQGIRLGISVEEIIDRERMKVSRLIQKLVVSDSEYDKVITRKGEIVCPNCGERIESVGRVKQVIEYYKEFSDQCSCGERYEAKPRSSESMILSLPDRQLKIIC